MNDEKDKAEPSTYSVQSADKNDSFKKQIDGYSALASLAYKLAAALGAVITFAYLFSIEFFPTGLTPGEVVFFVFVALAFGFLYVVLLLYGAISAIWFAQAINSGLQQFRFRSKGIVAASDLAKLRKRVADRSTCLLAKKYRSVSGGIRGFRRTATRNAIKKHNPLPREVRGAGYFFISIAIFSVMTAVIVLARSSPLAKLTLAFWVGGFIALVVAGAPPGQSKETGSIGEQPRRSTWFRWAAVLTLPLFIVLAMGPSMSLLHMVFQGLGIRAPNVSIEIPESELGAIERVSDAVGRPLLDCRRAAGGRLLVHNANVLWTGVGNASLVSFVVLTTPSADLLGPDPSELKKVSIRLDTNSVRIIKTKPPLDPCFDLPNDMLFETAKYELTPPAQARLQAVATAIQATGQPIRIVVRGHSDARPIAGPITGRVGDNQRLSELRAEAVAEVLRKLIKVPGLTVTSEGAGSREPKVKCPAEVAGAKYEAEQCNAPNRRVEVRVTYSRSIKRENRQPELKKL